MKRYFGKLEDRLENKSRFVTKRDRDRKNKGLANSIINGFSIGYMIIGDFEENDPFLPVMIGAVIQK